MTDSTFSYDEAFSRNIGWITKDEQALLRHSKIAIAGMGGVGGSYLITLTRLGVGAFHIADFDLFELPNFNRQIGAKVSSLGQTKISTLASMAYDINPELELSSFAEGVQIKNLDKFLEGVDIYIDGLDFFALDIRRKIFKRCREKKIPAITVAPVGMGAAFLIFSPKGMSFEDYFRMENRSPKSQIIRFLLGLTPAGLHRTYFIDKTSFNISHQQVPSTGLACELCAGIATAQAIKLLLNRGPVYAAPWYQHFDAYTCRWVKRKLRFGNNGFFQRIRIALAENEYLLE
ncbi:ThiF family adenylyltransferase [Salmonella enterica subsp. salamae]|nr:ThiF family adenylyltransferase [Salmonella enterica subsp. salamae]ECJ2280672.1 ThiF family adenylyltransferase [Salmonella enterica subsp. salamae]